MRHFRIYPERMTDFVELEPGIRQALEGALSAATDRLALPLFDLGFLLHDLMGPSKKLIYVEPLLPPGQTPSALNVLTVAQQQQYRAFCDAAFARLLAAGEVVTSLGAFRAVPAPEAIGRPLTEGVHPFWQSQRLLVAVDAQFAQGCRSEYQSRFMSRFPGGP